jgi:hypothetical protein
MPRQARDERLLRQPPANISPAPGCQPAGIVRTNGGASQLKIQNFFHPAPPCGKSRSDDALLAVCFSLRQSKAEQGRVNSKNQNLLCRLHKLTVFLLYIGAS